MLAFGLVGGQGLFIVAAPVLTRIYEAQHFGVFGIYLSIIGIFTVFTCWRFELAIPIARDEIETHDVVRLCLVLMIATVALIGGTAALFSDALSKFIPTADLNTLMILVAVGLLATTIHRVGSYHAVRLQAYRRIAQASVVEGLIGASTQILLGSVLDVTPHGLIVGYIGGHVVATAWLLPAPLVRATFNPFRYSAVGLCNVLRLYARFALVSGPATVLNSLTNRLPMLIVASAFGATVGGWFALTERIVRIPIRTIGEAVGRVYLGRIGQVIRQDPGDVYRIFRRSSFVLMAVGGVVSTALVIFSPAVFSFAFGPEWREAGVYARFLGVMLLGQFVVVPLSQSLNAVQKQPIQLAADAVRLSLVLLAFTPALLGFGGPRLAVGALGILGAAGYGVNFLLTRQALRGIAER
jgi:O-antigen/teichoic acid export membrane protein